MVGAALLLAAALMAGVVDPPVEVGPPGGGGAPGMDGAAVAALHPPPMVMAQSECRSGRFRSRISPYGCMTNRLAINRPSAPAFPLSLRINNGKPPPG